MESWSALDSTVSGQVMPHPIVEAFPTNVFGWIDVATGFLWGVYAPFNDFISNNCYSNTVSLIGQFISHSHMWNDEYTEDPTEWIIAVITPMLIVAKGVKTVLTCAKAQGFFLKNLQDQRITKAYDEYYDDLEKRAQRSEKEKQPVPNEDLIDEEAWEGVPEEIRLHHLQQFDEEFEDIEANPTPDEIERQELVFEQQKIKELNEIATKSARRRIIVWALFWCVVDAAWSGYTVYANYLSNLFWWDLGRHAGLALANVGLIFVWAILNTKQADKVIYSEQLYKVHWETYRARKDKPFVVINKQAEEETEPIDYDPEKDKEDGVGEIDFNDDFYDGFGFYSRDEIDSALSF